MNANFGLLPDLPNRVAEKHRKKEMLAARALDTMRVFVRETAAVPA